MQRGVEPALFVYCAGRWQIITSTMHRLLEAAAGVLSCACQAVVAQKAERPLEMTGVLGAAGTVQPGQPACTYVMLDFI